MSQELIIAPAVKGPWGVIPKTAGPRDTADGRFRLPPEARRADALLRAGMVALGLNSEGRKDVPRAERCFTIAAEILVDTVDAFHPFVAYAMDRLGLACQMQEQLERAERFYRKSLTLWRQGGWPATPWTEVTLLNLAILYGAQGRHDQHAAVMQEFRSLSPQAGEVSHGRIDSSEGGADE